MLNLILEGESQKERKEKKLFKSPDVSCNDIQGLSQVKDVTRIYCSVTLGLGNDSTGTRKHYPDSDKKLLCMTSAQYPSQRNLGFTVIVDLIIIPNVLDLTMESVPQIGSTPDTNPPLHPQGSLKYPGYDLMGLFRR